eukprot:15332101-Ditylum_brightwellii.AAC.1
MPVYKEDFKIYSNYLVTANVLKNQLLGAFDDKYVLAVYDQATGYEGSTVLQLLKHLYKNYGQLGSTQLMANSDEICRDYDPTTRQGSIMKNALHGRKSRQMKNLARVKTIIYQSDQGSPQAVQDSREG